MQDLSARIIMKRVDNAIHSLLRQDPYLLQKDVNERSISHRLAMYLQDEFEDWDVDCEYNRNYDDIKTLEFPAEDTSVFDTHAVTVYPDIIVHRRGSDNNLLVIEVKKTTNNNAGDWDVRKLRSYKDQLRYGYAVFLRLRTGVEHCEIAEIRWL